MPEKMKNFYTYLLENNILCNTCNMNGTTLISKLMNILAGQCNSLDAEDAAKEVEKREALFSTVIAPGLAVPHARISSIDKPLVAMPPTIFPCCPIWAISSWVPCLAGPSTGKREACCPG